MAYLEELLDQAVVLQRVALKATDGRHVGLRAFVAEYRGGVNALGVARPTRTRCSPG
jgi:hypothetical protein